MSNREFEPRTDLPVQRHASVLDLCRTVAKQIRGDVPAAIHSREQFADEWDSYATVNDPASGKQVPNEGHATDEWDSYETVNDPASGKQVPNEGHAAGSSRRFEPPLLLTDTFVRQTEQIYAAFGPTDLEYPAMGVTIEGAAIFVECLRYPDEAVVRHQWTDEVNGVHPEITALLNATLLRHNGKCRYCSVHIHPMDLPQPSSVDIANYERVRTDVRAPNMFGKDEPFPFVLVNLHGGALQLLGFVVDEGACRPAAVERVRDDDPRVAAAWERATPLPYFRPEAKVAEYIAGRLSTSWNVRFGAKMGEDHTAVLAQHEDGRRAIIRFDPTSLLGLGHDLLDSRAVRIEKYVDWQSLLDDLALPAAAPMATPNTAVTADGPAATASTSSVKCNGTSPAEAGSLPAATEATASEPEQRGPAIDRRRTSRRTTATSTTHGGPRGPETRRSS